jgi:Spy/CpxP family protein refolding chaperone
MKKIGMRATIVALALAMLGGVAWARGPGPGPGNCPGAAASPEQAQKIAAFQQQIQPLREKMFQLRTELVTLRAQENPDWAAIAAKQKEMVDVRVEIQKQAAEAGVGYGFGGGPGRGGGMGFGGGRGMGCGGPGWN